MTDRVRIKVGATLRGELREFGEAWKRAERGEDVRERVLAFESFEAFAAALTPKRVRLLLVVRDKPMPSVKALADALDRDYRRVHGDVAALVEAGLLEREGTAVKATADRVVVEI